ncbi:hypothetical protein JG688_00014925, partial [Phytophthora aleatoria]
PSPAKSSRGRPRTRSLSAFSKQATPVSSPPPSSVPASPCASKDSPQATPRAKDDSRSHVPPPAGGEMAPEAPARTGEAFPATKKVPSSIDPGTPPYKATPLAEQGYEDEGVPFRDLSNDEDEDRSRSTRASSSSAAHRPSGVTAPYRSSSDESDSSSDEGSHDHSIMILLELYLIERIQE